MIWIFVIRYIKTSVSVVRLIQYQSRYQKIKSRMYMFNVYEIIKQKMRRWKQTRKLQEIFKRLGQGRIFKKYKFYIYNSIGRIIKDRILAQKAKKEIKLTIFGLHIYELPFFLIINKFVFNILNLAYIINANDVAIYK